ncbi:MAG: hypothetical protein KAW56_02930, partial [Candidatus Marinimicrobia bacterium]|nr:hypothetical protein [Candidatus Neomarinimicrobiota bacterium]
MSNTEIYKESIAKLLKETDDIVFQIRSLRYKNQELTAENDKDIEELQKMLLETEATLEKTLTESKEDAIKPKCGWAHFKAMKDKLVIKDVAKTMEEIRVKLPSFVDILIKYVETYSIRKDKLNQLVKDETIR